MTARAGFRQDDLARAIRGAISAGVRIARIEISPTDGRIVIVIEASSANQQAKTNPWDEEFNEN